MRVTASHPEPQHAGAEIDGSGPFDSGQQVVHTGIAGPAISRKAADVLIAAGLGRGSSGAQWTAMTVTTVAALLVAFAAFALSARRRS
mgnify:CR=1 FL=1